MTSIKDKAKKAAARSKCTKCEFWKNGLCVDPRIAKVCVENYVRGYLRGYEQRRKEETK